MSGGIWRDVDGRKRWLCGEHDNRRDAIVAFDGYPDSAALSWELRGSPRRADFAPVDDGRCEHPDHRPQLGVAHDGTVPA